MAYRDTTVEVRDFWKGELAQAIQDLRMEYERRIENSKVELETMYTTKVEEVTTTTVTTSSEVSFAKQESERLKVELTTLRERMPALEERVSHQNSHTFNHHSLVKAFRLLEIFIHSYSVSIIL